MLLAEVILRNSVDNTDLIYTYKIPDDLAGKIREGLLVEVPFGMHNGTRDALVLKVGDGSYDGKFMLKSVKTIKDPLPVMKPDQIALIDYIQKRYVCRKGDALSLMVPSVVAEHKDPLVRFVELTDEAKAREMLAGNKIKSINQIRILESLFEKSPARAQELLIVTSSSNANLYALSDKGLIRIFRQEDKAVPEEERAGHVNGPVHELNPEQKYAVGRICEERKNHKVFLLHGITGSGKTEVFLKCAESYLEKGHSVLYLVPEISLTPQTIRWITGRFDREVAVLHSRLTAKERYAQWDKIRKGEAKIIVAARSGVFAPIDGLKLIIIDEEHDSSYKSDKHPKYSAKDIAIARAKLTGATVVLGSATPSIETYYAAENGYYELLRLTQRANPNARLPKVTIVDMKEQIRQGAGSFFSIPLKNKMLKALSEDKQIILFLNRRGYSRTLICKDCGEPLNCPSCSVGLTLHTNRHSKEKLLICHYCGYAIPVSEASCSDCGSRELESVGFGTQQLEEQVKKTFPGVSVLRMDQDSTAGIGAHEKILNAFREKKAQVLIGTQMIAKGHDFPEVTVVGVLDADIIAASPDYRGSERAFQLITQASGRAGRDNDPGEVFIQTYKPDNPLIMYAACQDYESFFNAQLEYRQALNLPPFKASGEIMISSGDEDELMRISEDLSNYLRDFLSYQSPDFGFELYGPIPAAIYELRGSFRNVFNIKAKNKSSLNAVFKQVLKDFDYTKYPISVDSDK
ncbi:MAG: primosomal protein N' [Clostridiales bacterium]|nr:primosomal protein N' [Clostridiales bacterium]